MDKNLFTSNSPGKLVEISISKQQRDLAFIPNDLPTRMEISQEIWPLLMEAYKELVRLDTTAKRIPNYELFLKPLQAREALTSSSLEGTYVTPEQLLLYEIDPRIQKSQHERVNSWKEVSNYSKSLRKGQELLNELPVCLRLITELHKELLSGVRGDESNPGEFRDRQVHIGSDRRFVPPPPNDASTCLDKLEKYINEPNNIDPLILCFLVHYQFETIHPFLDGNGRVGRLLLSLMVFKCCQLASPWLYLSAFFDKYKEEYIKNLFNVSAKGDWDNWTAFCLRATIHQAKDAVSRFDRLFSLRESYRDRISKTKSSNRGYKIIDILFNELPIISIAQISKEFNITYHTAKNDVELLVKQDILKKAPFKTRPQFFLSPEIMSIAHTNIEIE